MKLMCCFQSKSLYVSVKCRAMSSWKLCHWSKSSFLWLKIGMLASILSQIYVSIFLPYLRFMFVWYSGVTLGFYKLLLVGLGMEWTRPSACKDLSLTHLIISFAFYLRLWNVIITKASFSWYNLLRYQLLVLESHMVALLTSWVEVDCKTLQLLLYHILQIFFQLQAHGMLNWLRNMHCELFW